MRAYESWGRYPRVEHTRVLPLRWRSETPPWESLAETVLPFAYGRSYGDSCLNAGGALLDTTGLCRFIAFDESEGTLRCEAGVSLAAVLQLIVPHGWFVPVLPGTQWVSIGGAIANDIHGKNHHQAGTFGVHVTCLELLRSSGERVLCSADRNSDLFRATIGGLGLTGLILWAELRLKRVPGAAIAVERIRFANLAEFFHLSTADQEYEYTVAWVDCLARGRRLGRGIFLRGDHSAEPLPPRNLGGRRLAIPMELPSALVNRTTMGMFNSFYYRGQLRQSRRTITHYEPFFFPLDKIRDWNRVYGRGGFFQHQCVVPDDGGNTIASLLDEIARSTETPSLAVLKRFGQIKSPGLLSFPRPGITLAVDFANRGAGTLAFLDRLDELVAQAGGAVYPAKDSRMSAASFQRFYPGWEAFARKMDPRFSSSFWRRVTRG